MIESPTHYSDSSEWEHIINIENNSLNSFDESADCFDESIVCFDESADYFDESIVCFDESIVCFDESIDRNIDFQNNNTSTSFSNIFDSEIIAQPYEMDTDIFTQKISDSSWKNILTNTYLCMYQITIILHKMFYLLQIQTLWCCIHYYYILYVKI